MRPVHKDYRAKPVLQALKVYKGRPGQREKPERKEYREFKVKQDHKAKRVPQALKGYKERPELQGQLAHRDQ